MKIKLMIISLLVVVNLYGMESSRKDTLTLALNHCLDSESYRLNDVAFINKKCQRPVVIHYFNDTDEQYSSDDKIKKIVAGSLKRMFVERFAEIFTINLFSDAGDGRVSRKILSDNHEQWIEKQGNQIVGDRRTKACMFYNIANNNKSMNEYVEHIKEFLRLDKKTPLLVNINSLKAGALDILDVLGKDVEVFNREAVFTPINTCLDGELSLDILVKKAKELNVDAKKFDKSQPGYISTFKSFLINHRGRLAGVFSLTALLVYYYNFIR